MGVKHKTPPDEPAGGEGQASGLRRFDIGGNRLKGLIGAEMRKLNKNCSGKTAVATARSGPPAPAGPGVISAGT